MPGWREDLLYREPQSDVLRLEAELRDARDRLVIVRGFAAYWQRRYCVVRGVAWALAIAGALGWVLVGLVGAK